MLPKKNPNLDPGRNSWLFFLLGLVATLALTYTAIESKTFSNQVAIYHSKQESFSLDEPVPITITPEVAVPKKNPIITEDILIVDDLTDVPEDIEIPIVDDYQVEIVRAENIVVFKDPTPEDIPIPWVNLEEIPVFPGCEKLSKEKQRECFLEKIQQHIRKNFKYPDGAMDAGIQGKVFVNFIIDKDGVVSISNLRGPDKSLENEAGRIISKLPKMTPGKQSGKPVRMAMSIPITFLLNR
jgi:protein TonB